MARARNRWGWGFQDAVIGAAEARAAAPGVVATLGFGSTDVEEPLPTPRAARAAGRPSRARWPRSARPSDRDRACHSLGKSYIDTIRAFRGRYEHVVDVVVRPRRRGARSRTCSNGPRTRTSRSSRTAAARASSAASSRGSRARSTARCRSTSARWTGCSRSTRSRARRASARAPPARAWRSSSAPHGLTHALLPAVLRALDARGMDRDARRRALRHRPHPHRRPRRGRARDHADRDVGVAATAGLGRRALARPDAARLGGDPRRHHRGVGARAAAPVAPRRARRCASPRSWPAPRRCGRSSRPACGPPTAG